MQVKVEFGGGAERLFDNQKTIELTLDQSRSWTLKHLICHLRDRHLKESPELFVSGDSVRPGILVLVNNTDWELLGDKDYELNNRDEILFMSTLHGG